MSALARTFTRARRSKTVVISGGTLVAIAIVSILGPLLSPHDLMRRHEAWRLIHR